MALTSATLYAMGGAPDDRVRGDNVDDMTWRDALLIVIAQASRDSRTSRSGDTIGGCGRTLRKGRHRILVFLAVRRDRAGARSLGKSRSVRC